MSKINFILLVVLLLPQLCKAQTSQKNEPNNNMKQLTFQRYSIC